MTIEDFGGRKFIFAMFVILCAFLLVISGQINFKEFMDTVLWVFGIFAGANAVAHLSPTPTVNNIKVESKNND